MKNSAWVFITITTLITIILILGIALLFEDNSQTAQKTASQQTNQTNGDMSSHHGGAQPANSQIFDGLKGKTAPDFTLEDYTGKKVSLSSYKGKKVVLFFTEGLMCYPACWNQMAAFGKSGDFDKDTVIFNIVVDDKNEWTNAVKKMPELASAIVLFDTNRQVSSLYGALTLPSSMHKGQYPGHTYLVLDREGIIQYSLDDIQMAVRNNELKAELSKLQ